ncbi:hypothetical protein GOBAR_AA17718 [Gossypium barbadense]|uniref:Uncharacterized protein n=1 Tax=Gossypium barbadense TaxID=3634 RepID=A0A2P5XHX4_GOSBA|nr:hypothetical protein GOBAR_AA17718 [Gossypium barbadense]
MACLQAAKLGLDLGILTAEIEGMSYPWYGNCKITESKDIENTKSTCVGYQSCVFRHMPRQANGSAPMHGGFQEKRKKTNWICRLPKMSGWCPNGGASFPGLSESKRDLAAAEYHADGGGIRYELQRLDGPFFLN